MEPRKEMPRKQEPRKEKGRKPRFRLVKLEERVVPTSLAVGQIAKCPNTTWMTCP